jgi:hypothetical protein
MREILKETRKHGATKEFKDNLISKRSQFLLSMAV